MQTPPRRLATGVLTAAVILGAAGLMLRAEPQQAVGTWAAAGAVNGARSGAASIALADGRTLVAGGIGEEGSPTASVVVYDPVSNSVASAGQLLAARVGHSGTLLEDGRVLVAGGSVNGVLSADLEIFDPAAGSSMLAGSMAQPRSGHTAARIAGGRVLIVGGAAIHAAAVATGELFDPSTGGTTILPSSLSQPRAGASATTLIDGRVLVAGGRNNGGDLATAEIFDPYSETFSMADTQLSVARSGHTAVLLPHNNSVLIAGGVSAGQAVSAADLFLPAEFPDPYSWGMGRFAATGAMASARSGAIGGPGHADGYAFVTGGGTPAAERYRFATIKTDKDDYAPGELAVITGSGWRPNEEVTLLFQEDPAVHADYVLRVRADAAGNIYWDQWSPETHDLGVRFYLMASDLASRAQTTFTDAFTVKDVTVGPQTPNPVPQGNSATYSVTVNFNGNNSTACTAGVAVSGLPSGATFSFLSSTVTSADPTTTLTVGTTGVTPNPSPATAYSFTVTATMQNTSQGSCNASSGTGTGTLRVAAPTNNEPIAAGQSDSTNEDTTKTITLSGSDVDGNALTFEIVTSPTGGTLGAIGPVTCGATPNTCTADVLYTPNLNFNGSDSFTFRVKDATLFSAAATVSITVNAVNDPPSFTGGGNVTVNEDSAPYSAAWATGISAGPNESGQTVTFTTSNDNPSLFSVQPAVSSSGLLTFTPAANAFGSATVTIYAQDNGGTANLGDDTSDSQTFTITITEVNDAPSFTGGGNVTVNEDSVPYSVAWATAISAGPPNESGQTVTFTTSNGNPSLFSVQPAVSSSGVLTFTPAPNAFGSATVTIFAKDNGGTANLGDDTSDSQTFTITITEVNDAPSFTGGGNVTVNEDSAPFSAAWATAISAGPPNESGQTVTFTTSNDNPSLFSAQPAVSSSGVLTFTPAANAFGNATVTIYAQDNGGTANLGDDTSDSQTFTITVNAVNDPPAITSLTVNKVVINENESVMLSGTFTDPDGPDSHTVTINWGDLTVSAVLPLLPAGTFAFSASHTYLDDNPTATASDYNTIVVTVTDDGATTADPSDARYDTASTIIQVKNLVPAIGTVGGPVDPVQLGGGVTITAAFTDVGTADTHTCTIDWDDASTSSGTVTESSGAGSCTANRLFAAAGVYTVKVTITDDDTGTVSQYYQYVVIYDPSAGFVTGGGWFNSPAGAYAPDLSLTGKANFGFVSKYQKGAKIPTGQTEFQFKAGDLNFHSMSYDWLVVAGAKAQYKGLGKINDMLAPNNTPYKFLLTATDGHVNGGGGQDKFRIKIWYENAGSVHVVYDNAPGPDDIDQSATQPLNGGSVTFHSGK